MTRLIRLFICTLACLFFSGCEGESLPTRFLVPPNYEGAVLTVYEQPGFPELPTEGGFRVHRFPADGILFTSSKNDFRPCTKPDEALEVMPDGSRHPLPGGRHVAYRATGGYTGPGLNVNYESAYIGDDTYLRTHGSDESDKQCQEAIRRIEDRQKTK